MENALNIANLVVDFVRSIRANSFGVTLLYEGTPSNLKKGTANNRTTAAEMFYDAAKKEWALTKRTIYKNVTFQRSYEHSVENRADNPLPYVVEKPSGMTWVEGAEGILLRSDTDPTKFYLRISENKNTKYETTYYHNGTEVSAEGLAAIREATPPKKICPKQAAYGVSEENAVNVKSINLNNIIAIKYGEMLLKLR